MKARTWLIVSATTAALLVTPAGALAAPGGDLSNCDETFKERGTVYCINYAGNSDNSWTTDKKGSANSSHDAHVTNPGGQQPRGQN